MKINNYELHCASMASMASKAPADTYINEIDAAMFLQLTEILDVNSTWKKLISVLPDNTYSAKHVYRFEQETFRCNGGSSSSALLHDLGNKGLTVSVLIKYLERLHLERALVLLKDFEEVTLIKDVPPESVAQCGMQCHFRVECCATGFPRPSYQWFKLNLEMTNWEELLDQTNAVLHLHPVRSEDAGFYCCRVSNCRPNGAYEDARCKFSSTLNLKVTPEMVISRPYKSPEEECDEKVPPVITTQPCCPSRPPYTMGSTLVFTCEATSTSPVVYEWFKNGSIIRDETTPQLHIKNLQPIDDETKFTIQCRVSNFYGSTMSKLLTIPLAPPSECAQFFAEDKVALLIANETYHTQSPLNSPIVDAITLANQLKKLDFKVLALVNLTRDEMSKAVDEFCNLIDKDVYVVFYYVGHGFQVHGQHYMLPVDAEECDTKQSLCFEDIYARMQCQDPALLCFILDMCRSDPFRESCVGKENIVTYYPKPNRNAVRAFATSDFCSALDGSKGSNGIFMKHLKKFICSDKPVKDVLDLVVREISVDTQASKRQYPEVSSNLARLLKLTDPIKSQRPSANDRLRRFSMLTDPQLVDIKRKVTTQILCEPYQHVIHNMLDITVSVDSTEFWTAVESVYTQLQERVHYNRRAIPDDDNHEYVKVTVSNLQKIQGELCLLVHLLSKKTGTSVECYDVRIGSPLICAAKLWQHGRNEHLPEEEEESGFASDAPSL